MGTVQLLDLRALAVHLRLPSAQEEKLLLLKRRIGQMKIKPYTANNGGTGMIWLLPTIIVSTGPDAFKERRRIFDVAFHWITFGFGVCFEWGRK